MRYETRMARFRGSFDICPALSGPVADLPRIGQREKVPFEYR